MEDADVFITNGNSLVDSCEMTRPAIDFMFNMSDHETPAMSPSSATLRTALVSPSSRASTAAAVLAALYIYSHSVRAPRRTAFEFRKATSRQEISIINRSIPLTVSIPEIILNSIAMVFLRSVIGGTEFNTVVERVLCRYVSNKFPAMLIDLSVAVFGEDAAVDGVVVAVVEVLTFFERFGVD